MSDDDFVIGFVGRLTRDKGIADLVAAFHQVQRSHGACRLLIIGDPEDGDPLPSGLLQRIEDDPQITVCSWKGRIEEYYPLMDVLAFPSYREGFPNAPLEAACAAVPTVAYRVTGSVDAVADDSTGQLVAPGDVDGLVTAIDKYLESPDLRQLHGKQASRRAVDEFRREIVWNALTAEYQRLFSRFKPSPRDHNTNR